jgi:hypothetical protein
LIAGSNASADATGAGDRPRDGLREHRSGSAIWIATPAWEEAGRALGLPDPAVIARLLGPSKRLAGGPVGRAATRIEPLVGSDRRLHVRRVLHGGWLAPLWRGRIAGLARVREELCVTARLHAARAPVPEPAFAVAQRSGLLWRAALCTLHIEDTIDGMRLLGEGARRLEAPAQAAGAAVRELHDRDVRHADLHVGNLLVRELEGGGYQAWVIDLDRAKQGAPLSARRRSRELRRLLRSLEKRIDDPTRLVETITAFRAGYDFATTPPAHETD